MSSSPRCGLEAVASHGTLLSLSPLTCEVGSQYLPSELLRDWTSLSWLVPISDEWLLKESLGP